MIQLGFDQTQPLVFLGRVEVPALNPLAQFTFLGDEVVDTCERVAVGGFVLFCHHTSVPDAAAS